MKIVDMSEQAILRRLRTVDRLRELSLALIKAKKVSDAKKVRLDLPAALTPLNLEIPAAANPLTK